jgi:hypothetical protein
MISGLGSTIGSLGVAERRAFPSMAAGLLPAPRRLVLGSVDR